MASGIKVRIRFDKKAIEKAVKRSNIDSLGRAGALVRTIARRSIRRKGVQNKPSKPGNPPKTTGPLRRSILFEVAKDKQDVIVGPSSDFVDNVGKAHEFGGKFRKEKFPKRPFMGPALEKASPRLPKLWAKSIRR